MTTDNCDSEGVTTLLRIFFSTLSNFLFLLKVLRNFKSWLTSRDSWQKEKLSLQLRS